jgi:hypothetical protein
MGGRNLPDWGPTRDPKRNAEIAAETAAQLRVKKRVDEGIAAVHQLRMDKLAHAAEYTSTLINLYLDEWAEWVNTAITDVSIPADKEGQIWWWVALAGNLIWAATTFINPAAAGAMIWIRVMSVSGGVVASGGLKTIASSNSPPAPTDENGAKDLLRKSLAKARGRLETHFKEQRFDWAKDFWQLADWDKTDPAVKDSFDKFIWQKMFPWIPHDEDRFEKIRSEAARMAKSVMADYLHQWKKFLHSNPYAGEGEMAKYAATEFHPKLKFTFGDQVLI